MLRDIGARTLTCIDGDRLRLVLICYNYGDVLQAAAIYSRRPTRFFLIMTNQERHEARYIRRREKREQKRINYNSQYDNYELMLDPINIYNSFYECKKGVSWKWSVQYFHLHLLENINEILKSLKKDKLLSKGFTYFMINERGKQRNIQSLHICERVQQKTLCNKILLPIFTRQLIYDNGASMRGKGVDFARRRLVHHLTEYRKVYGMQGYALVIDFSQYFASIDHRILLQMVKKHIHDTRVYNLCEQAVHEFGARGLGLGAQISQILAVYYPNVIDHYITNTLHIKYYGRYMDDSYILSPSREYLIDVKNKIQKKTTELNIKLNVKKTKIINLSHGINFLHCRYNYTPSGYIVKSGGKESAKRAKRKIKYFTQLLKNNKIDYLYIVNWYKSWRGFVNKFDSKNIMYNTDKYYNKYMEVDG